MQYADITARSRKKLRPPVRHLTNIEGNLDDLDCFISEQILRIYQPKIAEILEQQEEQFEYYRQVGDPLDEIPDSDFELVAQGSEDLGGVDYEAGYRKFLEYVEQRIKQPGWAAYKNDLERAHPKALFDNAISMVDLRYRPMIQELLDLEYDFGPEGIQFLHGGESTDVRRYLGKLTQGNRLDVLTIENANHFIFDTNPNGTYDRIVYGVDEVRLAQEEANTDDIGDDAWREEVDDMYEVALSSIPPSMIPGRSTDDF